METKYKFEVRAKHLQSTSSTEAGTSAKQTKAKSRSSALPDFVTSQWQESDSSTVYLIYRWILAIISVFSLVVNVLVDYERGVLQHYLMYQPHVNLILFMIVMMAGALLITNDLMNGSKLFMNCYDVLWHHTLTWTFCVTGTYWLGLSRETSSFNNILTHGLISTIFFADLFVIRCYHRFRSFLFTFIYTLCYLTFTFAFDFLGGSKKSDEDVYQVVDWALRYNIVFWQTLLLLICLASIHHLIQFGHFIRYQLSLTFFQRKKARTSIQI